MRSPAIITGHCCQHGSFLRSASSRLIANQKSSRSQFGTSLCGPYAHKMRTYLHCSVTWTCNHMWRGDPMWSSWRHMGNTSSATRRGTVSGLHDLWPQNMYPVSEGQAAPGAKRGSNKTATCTRSASSWAAKAAIRCNLAVPLPLAPSPPRRFKEASRNKQGGEELDAWACVPP